MTTVNIDNDYRIVVVDDSNGDTAVVTAPSPAVTVETTALGPQGPGGTLAAYATVIDTTDQPLVSTTTAQALTLNTTLESRGITISNGSRINFQLAGTYKVLASLQITNNSNNLSEVNIFFKQNGATIANSNTRIDLQPRKSVSEVYHDCFTIEFQVTVVNNDYIELYWVADHLGITIDTIPADTYHPQAPSAIINVAQVMFLQAVPPRSITIVNPIAGDNYTIFRTNSATTLSAVTALVSGTSPSVTYEIRYSTNRTSPGTLAIVPETVTNSTNGDAAVLQNQPIPADSYVWLVITATAGTVGEINVTLAF